MKASVFFQGLVKVVSIERSDALITSDADRKRYSAQFFLSTPREISEGEDSELFTLMNDGVTQGRYNIIVNLSDAGLSPESNPVSVLRTKYVGKSINATLFDAQVVDLLQGTKYEGTTIVHDDDKDLSKTFHAVRLGNAVEQAESVFDAMRSALLQRLENEDYHAGSIAAAEKKEKEAAQ